MTAVPTLLQALLLHLQQQRQAQENTASLHTPRVHVRTATESIQAGMGTAGIASTADTAGVAGIAGTASMATTAPLSVAALTPTRNSTAAEMLPTSSRIQGSNYNTPGKLTLRLKVLISSGEPLPWRLAHSLQQGLPFDCKLLNLYGSTEVAADCTCYDMTHMAADSAHVDHSSAHMSTHLAPIADLLPITADTTHNSPDEVDKDFLTDRMAAESTHAIEGTHTDADRAHVTSDLPILAMPEAHHQHFIHNAELSPRSANDEQHHYKESQHQHASFAESPQPNMCRDDKQGHVLNHVQSHVPDHVQNHVQGHMQATVPAGWPIAGFAICILKPSSPFPGLQDARQRSPMPDDNLQLTDQQQGQRFVDSTQAKRYTPAQRALDQAQQQAQMKRHFLGSIQDTQQTSALHAHDHVQQQAHLRRHTSGSAPATLHANALHAHDQQQQQAMRRRTLDSPQATRCKSALHAHNRQQQHQAHPRSSSSASTDAVQHASYTDVARPLLQEQEHSLGHKRAALNIAPGSLENALHHKRDSCPHAKPMHMAAADMASDTAVATAAVATAASGSSANLQDDLKSTPHAKRMRMKDANPASDKAVDMATATAAVMSASSLMQRLDAQTREEMSSNGVRFCEAGEVGEIAVAGAGLALGYHRYVA